MHYEYDECRRLTVKDLMGPQNTGKTWGPASFLGCFGVKTGPSIVSCESWWNRKDPPAEPVDALCTISLTTRSLTGYLKSNPSPWTQDLVIIAQPRAGRLSQWHGRTGRKIVDGGCFSSCLILCPRCGTRRRELFLPLPEARQWLCRKCWRAWPPSQAGKSSFRGHPRKHAPIAPAPRPPAPLPPAPTVEELFGRMIAKRIAREDRRRHGGNKF
jgi:hypothetical protein